MRLVAAVVALGLLAALAGFGAAAGWGWVLDRRNHPDRQTRTNGALAHVMVHGRA
ncbi:MAG: hypothetical protein AB7L84_11525 [Acidimicrobiia bacterium]